MDDYADDFSSGVNFPSPGSSATLYFKGSVPSGVASMISLSGLSVSTVGGTGQNFDEWRTQSDAIATWLTTNGYTEYAVAFDSVNTIDVVIGGGVSLPTLPGAISGNVSMSGTSNTYTPTGSIRGGSQMYDGSSLECTSGWTVEDSGGTRGMVTAGHCSGLDAIDDRFGTSYGATFQGQHLGTHGDLEWHTTTQTEVAVFWATDSTDRDVEDVKGSFWRNDATFGYGRASNVRASDQVYRTSVTISSTLGVLGHLVLTDTQTGALGDSGGGWSEGTEAHGVQSGWSYFNSAWRNAYSKASRIDNALGVEVRIVP